MPNNDLKSDPVPGVNGPNLLAIPAPTCHHLAANRHPRRHTKKHEGIEKLRVFFVWIRG
ncbi:MAG: hypothetical protein J2P21_07640 [Chloracidobacterium sp.]|nr:hypothetical protein [Chloracidobacterium sp.]